MSSEFTNNSQSIPKMYQTVINDVISSCRDSFLDEGYDEQTLTDLRNSWCKKLKEAGVFNVHKPRQMHQVQYGHG